MTEAKPIMPQTNQTSRSDIDGATNAYMRKVIGERLGQHLGTEAPMPAPLQRLLDQFRLQDKLTGD